MKAWVLWFLVFAWPALASDFDPDTGLRIHHYTQPTPDSVPGGTRIDVNQAYQLWQHGAQFIDVLSISQGRYDEFDGTWPAHPERFTIPGAVWLPNVGFGRPQSDMQAYLRHNLVNQIDTNSPVVVFCIADCWMGWNATQHVAAMGYQQVYWFAEGTDAWAAAGYDLSLVQPEPVPVED